MKVRLIMVSSSGNDYTGLVGLATYVRNAEPSAQKPDRISKGIPQNPRGIGFNQAHEDVVDDFFSQIKQYLKTLKTDKGDEAKVENTLRILSSFIKAHDAVRYQEGRSLTETMLKKFGELREAMRPLEMVHVEIRNLSQAKGNFEGIKLTDKSREHITSILRMLDEIASTLVTKDTERDAKIRRTIGQLFK